MRDLIIICIIVAVALVGARIGSRDSRDTGIETTGNSEVSEVEPGDLNESPTSSPSSAVQETPSAESIPSTSAGSLQTILVSAQHAGSEVTVDAVTFTSPSWIAIHEERAGGLGNVLGAAWFPAGTHKNVMVSLLRSTVSGNRYYAALYEDNGNKKYDHRVDAAIKDSLGNPIVYRFDVTAR